MIQKKLLLVGLLIAFAFSLSAQSGKTRLNINTIDDPAVVFPADVDKNYDDLLLQWTKQMRVYDECDYSESGLVTFPDSVYIERLYALPTKMELSFNPIVKRFIEMYAGRRRMVSNMLGEGEYYFPLFEEALEKEGLPLELKYLPVIESALNPVARSRVGATGLWQFMLATGRMYNLEVNSLVDERSDPRKSTDAAVQYMKALYGMYGDWNLVIAAYNCGPGNVNKAIRRAGGLTDYWAIYPYLPRETRSYVPIFIAATYIMSYYQEHNICPTKMEMPFLMDSVIVNKNVHFQQIADVLNISVDDIRAYNPQYRTDIVPGAYKPYVINLPLSSATLFVEKRDTVFKHRASELLTHRKTAGVSAVAAVSGQTYKVKKGDTLGGIARKYGVSVASLQRWNGLKSNNISIGRNLYVSNPVAAVAKKEKKKPEPVQVIASKEPDNTETVGLTRVVTKTKTEMVTKTHTVKKGETLASIAKANAVAISEIKAWNNMTSNTLVAGKKLKIKKMEVIEYEETITVSEPALASLELDANYLVDLLSDYAGQIEPTALSNFPRISLDNSDDKADFGRSIEAEADNIIYHKVKIGETLTMISTRYSVSNDDVVKWNNLTSNAARVGQRLMIYLPQNYQ